MTGEQLIFLALSGAAVLTALATILARNPVHSGAMLVLSFVNVAGLFVLLGAEFLAVAELIIYGGAILVLVVFVLMLVRLDDLPEMHAGHPVQLVVAPIVGLAAFLEVVAVAAAGFPLGQGGPWTPEVVQAVGGNAQAFGRVLYTEYLFPFVVVSLVLLVAAIGAMALARRTKAEEMEATGSISLTKARSTLSIQELREQALARGEKVDAAALANMALETRSGETQGRQP
jgi:NADH-quinone oxidoreductase subunit J